LYAVSFAALSKQQYHIALVGNPNSGKSSLFNALTGLNQKVGNFPGVTVDKKTGIYSIINEKDTELIDLPGTYSLYPRRSDEWVAYKVLMGADTDVKADMVILVADASNLKRNLLFCSQIVDLKIPVVMALTMNDLAAKKDIKIDIAKLEKELGIPVVAVNPRKNKGLGDLKKAIAKQILSSTSDFNAASLKPDFIEIEKLAPAAIAEMQSSFPALSKYAAIHHLINYDELQSASEHARIESMVTKHQFNPTKTQAEEIMQRYTHIRQLMKQCVIEPGPLDKKMYSDKIDQVLLHRTWGYVILLAVLFLLKRAFISQPSPFLNTTHFNSRLCIDNFPILHLTMG
jgi:ferrous iron transport protein B